MSLHPVPLDFEARCNAVFDAVMWSLARPGVMRDLPQAGLAQVVEALIDRECAVHCRDEALAMLARRTGAELAGLEAADHVFAETVTPEMPDRLACGSDLHPEDGATLVAGAVFGTGQRLRLTGPGVDGEVIVTIGGLPVDFWQRRARAMRYPMGFEMLLVDGARLIGVPRSTVVEVL